MARPYKKRASKFAPELIEELLARLAEGETLLSICDSDDAMPACSTVISWATDDEADAPLEGFAEKYQRARLVGYQRMADELLACADAETKDANRSRLQVDTRKWLLSKALPKIYGDKLDITSDGAPLKTYVIAPPSDPSA